MHCACQLQTLWAENTCEGPQLRAPGGGLVKICIVVECGDHGAQGALTAPTWTEVTWHAKGGFNDYSMCKTFYFFDTGVKSYSTKWGILAL